MSKLSSSFMKTDEEEKVNLYLKFSLVLNLFALMPTLSLACDCANSIPEITFSNSDAVVIAVAQENVIPSAATFQTPFKVVSSFKGVTESRLLISQEKTNCFVPFKKGETYLIYGNSKDGQILTNQCQRTNNLKSPRVAADLKYLSPTTNISTPLWTQLGDSEINTLLEKDTNLNWQTSVALAYCFFRLNDFPLLKQTALMAPDHNPGEFPPSRSIVFMPMVNGISERVTLYHEDTIAPPLEEKFQLHNYRGMGPSGIHGMSTDPETLHDQVLLGNRRMVTDPYLDGVYSVLLLRNTSDPKPANKPSIRCSDQGSFR